MIGAKGWEGPVGIVLSETTRENRMIVRMPRLGYRLVERLLIVATLLGGLVVLGAAAVLAYGLGHGPTAFAGVTVAGVDVGGLTVDEAQRRLDDRLRAGAPSQITLTFGGQRWDMPAQGLTVRYDTQASAQAAFAYGRSGNLWADSRAWLAALVRGHDMPLSVSLNEQAAYGALQRLAPSVVRSAQDARYVSNPSGTVGIAPGADGLGINASATLSQVRQRLASLSTQPVTLATVPVAPAVSTSALEGGLKQAEKIASKPLVLAANGATWEVDTGTLRTLISVQAGADGRAPAVTLRSEQLAAYIGTLSPQVDKPGQNATVVWQDGKFTVKSSVLGQTLDVDKSVAEIERALTAGQHQVTLQMRPQSAKIGDADAEDAARRAEALVAQPVKVNWGGGSADVAPATLAAAVRFEPQPDQTQKLAVSLDSGALGAIVQGLAKQVEVPAQNADLRYLNGKVTVVSPEKAGVTVDVAASAAALKNAVLSRGQSAQLVTTTVEPQITAAMASTIVIRDKLSSAATYYGGSLPNRRFNVDLAVERVNGALIPPGGVFSFTGTVGAIDLNSGFKVGYGIVATSNGSVSTVPSVGGGVCQVSTTAFQAAFWAGMPIVERNWHLYWIPLYGQPPSGLTGLDATVDTDAGLDFKFKNTTNDWLAVVGTADGQWVRFELWGTKPNWTVKVDDPVVTNVVKADTTMQYQNTDQLAKGTTVYVERAADGFDVNIRRQVLQDGKVIDDLNLKSHYVPSANVTLVGTR